MTQSSLFNPEEVKEMIPDGWFSFDEALRRMRQGKVVRRAGWVDVLPYSNARETDKILYLCIMSWDELVENKIITVNWKTDSGEYLVWCWERSGLDTLLCDFRIDDILSNDWYECDKYGNMVTE